MTPDLDALKQAIEAALARALPQHSPIAPELVAAMRYATLTGGKRLRPMLVCAACTGVGGTRDQALAPACAGEFIHATSYQTPVVQISHLDEPHWTELFQGARRP